MSVLESLRITRNADRTGCARLHAKKERIVGVLAAHLVSNLRKGIFQTKADMFRKHLMERGGNYPRMI